MDLYQLAMELDERSADVAERAEALGLGSVGPTTPLTPEQVSTLRAAYRKPDAPIPEGPVTVIGAAAPEPAERPAPQGPARHRAKTIGVVVGCLLALGGAVAFFAAQASPAEERREQMAQDLADWESAPPATVAPEVEAAVTFPADQPRDREQMCAARTTAAQHEQAAPPIENVQVDFTEYRAWALDRAAWFEAMNQVIEAGPMDAVPDITRYRDVRERQFRLLAQASDPDLRALAEGVELNDLEGYQDDLDDIRRDFDARVVPICGAVGA